MANNFYAWTIFDRPSDFPNCFVARKFCWDKPTDEFLTADTLEEIRKLIPACFDTRIDRYPDDHSSVVETWI